MKGEWTESGLMDREIGMAGAFSDEGNEKALNDPVKMVYRSTQIYTDGEKVYVHFAMNDLYTTQMQIQQMTLTINGQSFALGVYPVKEDHSIDWDFYNNEMRSLPNGIYKNLGVIINYTQYCGSEAAMTIYDSTHQPDTKGDELEFAFSLKDFQRITGLNTDHLNDPVKMVYRSTQMEKECK